MIYLKTSLFSILFVVGFGLLLTTHGCKKEEGGTGPPPSPGFTVSPSSVSLAPSDSTTATISGGTGPYSIRTGPDTTIATVILSGSSLKVNGVTGGYTTIIVADSASDSVTVGISVTGPISFTLFPLINNHNYIYAGYAISTSGVPLSDPGNIYRTSWTLSPGPGGSKVITDSTTLHLATDTTVVRLLLVRRPATPYEFLQTLGPFFRAFNIPRTDTTRWIPIADPSVGIGSSWTAFDSTYTDALSSQVRLEIIGQIEAGETIRDSSVAQTRHNTIRFRTWRRISVNGSVIVNNATTARIWLEKNVGPVQVHIAQDTENIGHFRVMRSKNF